jgi:putative SOS response-associated peptidase YedK
MCGRYVIEGTTELSERFQLRQIPADLFPEWTTYNASPTQLLPVIVDDEAGERTVAAMQWGLIPRWSRPDGKAGVAPINARAETLFEKPMFRGLTKAKRCIVPASGFYEWRKTGGGKQPYYITSDDGEAWGLAGLYDQTHDEENDAAGSFTIITTTANPLLAPLHDRMPVILNREDEDDWLSRDLDDPHLIEQFLRPFPMEEMEIYPVSRAVNSPRNNGPELIEPAETEE